MTATEKYDFFRKVTIGHELYGPPIGFGETKALFPLTDLLSGWRQTNVATQKAPSSALYIHIPFCINKRCSFCMYRSIPNYTDAQLNNYSRRIRSELDLWHEDLTANALTGLYVGGGTPNVYNPMQFEETLSPLAHLSYTSDSERTCELAACSAQTAHVSAMRNLGFNRMSLGVQSFDHNIITSVNREYASPDKVYSLIKPARDGHFIDVNVDLMIGLPHRTPENIRWDIRTAIECGALSISLYTYRNIHSPLSHDNEVKRQDIFVSQLAAAMEEIEDAKWDNIAGNDNTEYHLLFSPERKRGTMRFRTSMDGFSNHKVIGIGAFAHGFSPSIFYTCEDFQPLFNAHVPQYRIGILNKRQQMQTAVCNMLYSDDMRIDTAIFSETFGCSFDSIFEAEISELGELGKISRTCHGYKISCSSRLDAASLQKFFWDFSFLCRL